MIDQTHLNTEFKDYQNQVTWYGISFIKEDIFNSFLDDDVAARLYDSEGSQAFKIFLRGLGTTGFAHENLDKFLETVNTEERGWAIGESIAEAYLNNIHNVSWPWNMERDKRNIKASLPGADLIGLEINQSNSRLVLGEVKTSSEDKAPPSVIVHSRDGMIHQINELLDNLGKIYILVQWLYYRCKNTDYEEHFQSAVKCFIESGNKAISFFGVLVRDTNPNPEDLRKGGEKLSKNISDPTTCQLVAIYLPCNVSDLLIRISQEER